MKPESDERSLEDVIRRATGSDDVQFDETAWKRKHRDEVMLIESWKRENASVRATGPRQIWRTIMDHRLTRIAAPAAVAAAVIAVVVIIWTSGGSAAKVFADCLKQLQTTSYEFDMDISTTDGASTTLRGMVLEPGRLRLEQRGGQEAVSSVINNNTKQSLILFHQFKAAYRFDRQEAEALGALEFFILPGRSIEDLWNLKAGNEKELGTKEIDGKSAVGFQVTEKDDGHTQTISVWAEAKTGRPLKVDIVWRSNEQEKSALEFSMKNFKPAPDLNPALFDTAVPEGYTLADRKTLEQLTAEPGTGPAAAAATSPEAKKTLDSLDLWARGNKQKAVDLLMTVNWSGDVRFSQADHLFTVTERQYISLVTDDKRKVMDEIMPQMSQCRGLARELLEVGRKARASGQPAKAESYYTAALGLGRLLSRNPDGMLIVRLVGIAIQKLALEELSDLHEATNQPEKLSAVRRQLKQVEELQDQIRKKAS
ncbi:MAG: hypothetical protein ACYSWU_11405 [Planctomycetota bacterium]|jgi:outer membrane lipoprotein-sorting protein